MSVEQPFTIGKTPYFVGSSFFITLIFFVLLIFLIFLNIPFGRIASAKESYSSLPGSVSSSLLGIYPQRGKKRLQGLL
jgi:quinol-cytochrome oxidoreductase complex cytochrome b subunit